MKQIYKGYIPKDQNIKELFDWELEPEGDILIMNPAIGIYKDKGKRDQYMPQEYPPKKVKITIEVED